MVDDVIGNTYFSLYFLVQNIENHNFHIQYVDVGMVLAMMNMKLNILDMSLLKTTTGALEKWGDSSMFLIGAHRPFHRQPMILFSGKSTFNKLYPLNCFFFAWCLALILIYCCLCVVKNILPTDESQVFICAVLLSFLPLFRQNPSGSSVNLFERDTHFLSGLTELSISHTAAKTDSTMKVKMYLK